MKRFVFVATSVALLALAGCASVISRNETTVSLKVTPNGARCHLTGAKFAADAVTPAEVKIPADAGPITVSCAADGYRPRTQVFDAKSDGWIWANLALVAINPAIPVVGALFDKTRDAGERYQPEYSVALDPATPREVRLRQRDGQMDQTVGK